MADRTEATSDLAKLSELKREFDSLPSVRSVCHALCPNDCGTLSERDKVGAGIGCFDVTILFYCDSCGYYRTGDTYWTTDY
jgi:hypothetical protein